MIQTLMAAWSTSLYDDSFKRVLLRSQSFRLTKKCTRAINSFVTDGSVRVLGSSILRSDVAWV